MQLSLFDVPQKKETKIEHEVADGGTMFTPTPPSCKRGGFISAFEMR